MLSRMMFSSKYSNMNRDRFEELSEENESATISREVDIDIKVVKLETMQRQVMAGEKAMSHKEGANFLRSDNRGLKENMENLKTDSSTIFIDSEAVPSSFPTEFPTFTANKKSFAPVETTDNQSTQSMNPSEQPSSYPSGYPSAYPTGSPSESPVTERPSNRPTFVGSYTPTSSPTQIPSLVDQSKDIFMEPSNFPTSLPTVIHRGSYEIPAAVKFNSSGLLKFNTALFVITLFIALAALLLTVKELCWESSFRSQPEVSQQEDVELLVAHKRSHDYDDESRLQEKRQRGKKEKI